MPEYEQVECIPQLNKAPNLAQTTRYCSAGEQCVSYAVLGMSARLSRGNPGPECFACMEHHAAATLSKTEAKGCARGSCKRPAVEWQHGAHVCSEHAGAVRARRWQEECSIYALSCDANIRKALGAGDEASARNWSRLHEAARRRLARAEADLAAAEAAAEAKVRTGPTIRRFAM